MKNVHLKVSLLSLFFLVHQISFAQNEDFDSKMVPTKTGVSIDFKNNKHSFSFSVIGKAIKPYTGNGVQTYIDVDGKLLQYLLVPFPQKIDYSKLNLKQKQAFLVDYEGYEMESIKDNLKVKDLDEKLKYLNLNGNLFLFWVYDMPKQYKDIRQQCYLVTVCFDHMLVLNSPVEKNLVETMDFLENIGKSVQMK